MICPKCGSELPNGGTYCYKCSYKIPSNQDKTKTNANLDTGNTSKPIQGAKYNGKASSGTGCCHLLGIVLMIVGGICDIVTMCMIGSSSFESFKFVTIFGTISFFIGLLLTILGR